MSDTSIEDIIDKDIEDMVMNAMRFYNNQMFKKVSSYREKYTPEEAFNAIVNLHTNFIVNFMINSTVHILEGNEKELYEAVMGKLKDHMLKGFDLVTKVLKEKTNVKEDNKDG